MASSSSQSSQRRKPVKKRQPLVRSNSSLLGTIKNLVTAPLAWFSGADDFEDSKDLKGKRRRLAAAPTEPNVEEDDRLTRNKRMRVHSPPQDHQQSHQPPSGNAYGYLDPPGAVFQQKYKSNVFNQPPITRSVSLSTPAYDSPHNNNFIRANTLSRTMSIDPPSRPVSRSSAFASIPIRMDRDTSMDSSMTSVRRDLSLPPLSMRPSFRMRTSMTPVPQSQREASEPPPLNTLASNPIFVHGPSTADNSQHVSSQQATITLGSLMESVRSTRSPIRQHSSLLFGSGEPVGHNTSRHESPAEKALHELDIYKTPLVPTRLRSSNPQQPISRVTESTSTDLFRSRRRQNLVLMQDDKRINRLGRKASGKQESPLINGTKPYAGEGGMKKLLAKRKMEVQDSNEAKDPGSGCKVDQQEIDDSNTMDGNEKPNPKSETIDSIIPPPLPPPKPDWFATVPNSSSLRVGRTKTRSHIARPAARPMKTKFSAAYDDDDVMDDGEHSLEDGRKKEQEVLEEAARRVPIFEIPVGFSFAKENKKFEHDSSDTKEPPIISLPFSFAKPTSTPQVSSPERTQPEAVSSGPSSGSQTLYTSDVTPSQPPLAISDSVTLSSPQPPIQAVSNFTPADPKPSANNGVPNFFANSLAFSKPLKVPQPSQLVFPTSIFSTTSATTQSEPVKDAENPLWEDEKKETNTPAQMPNLFSGAENFTGEKPSLNVPTGIFSNPSPPVLISAPSLPTSIPLLSAPKLSGADVKKSDETPDTTSMPIVSPPSQTFTFSNPSKPPSLFVNAPEPTINMASNTEISKPITSFGSEATKAPTPMTFPFNLPSTSAPQNESIPKSIFGDTIKSGAADSQNPNFNGGGFSFVKEKDKIPATTPFSFGVPPSTPPPGDAKKSAVFSFEPPSIPTSAPAPESQTIGFSFSAGSNASDTSNNPFSFGLPAAMTPTDRPSTPPKNQDQEFNMEESPTRDVQQPNGNTKPPERSTSGFSFNTNAPVSLFGSQLNRPTLSSTPFSFESASNSNPFTKENKPPENKPFNGFGQPSAASTSRLGFSFSETKASDSSDTVRASISSPFTFGPTPSSATGTSPSFTFGPSSNITSNPFGQPQQLSDSAPSSPSTFAQPSPFSFAPPLPAVANTFSFSQPASPATGSTTLPQAATPGGFSSNSGFGQVQQPSPFGMPTVATPGKPTLFTIGAPPSESSGQRQIRKLPNRRGGVKR